MEGRAQLVTHVREELRLYAICAIGLIACSHELGFLGLGVCEFARDRNDRQALEPRAMGTTHWTAMHLGPHIARGFDPASMADPELDGCRRVVGKALREGREICGTIGHMHPLEKSISEDFLGRLAEKLLRAERREQHAR